MWTSILKYYFPWGRSSGITLKPVLWSKTLGWKRTMHSFLFQNLLFGSLNWPSQVLLRFTVKVGRGVCVCHYDLDTLSSHLFHKDMNYNNPTHPLSRPPVTKITIVFHYMLPSDKSVLPAKWTVEWKKNTYTVTLVRHKQCPAGVWSKVIY